MGGGIYTGMHGLLQIHTHEREGDGLGTPWTIPTWAAVDSAQQPRWQSWLSGYQPERLEVVQYQVPAYWLFQSPLGRGSHCHFLINLSRYYTSAILCLPQLVHAGALRQHIAAGVQAEEYGHRHVHVQLRKQGYCCLPSLLSAICLKCNQRISCEARTTLELLM